MICMVVSYIPEGSTSDPLGMYNVPFHPRVSGSRVCESMKRGYEVS